MTLHDQHSTKNNAPRAKVMAAKAQMDSYAPHVEIMFFMTATAVFIVTTSLLVGFSVR